MWLVKSAWISVIGQTRRRVCKRVPFSSPLVAARGWGLRGSSEWMVAEMGHLAHS